MECIYICFRSLIDHLRCESRSHSTSMRCSFSRTHNSQCQHRCRGSKGSSARGGRGSNRQPTNPLASGPPTLPHEPQRTQTVFGHIKKYSTSILFQVIPGAFNKFMPGKPWRNAFIKTSMEFVSLSNSSLMLYLHEWILQAAVEQMTPQDTWIVQAYNK